MSKNAILTLLRLIIECVVSKHAGKLSSSQLRIIAGKWRGRKLPILAVDGLRPTGDRIRETLFNWLAPLITDAECLDLFAGSGALGFEALSRGAKHAVLCEHASSAVKQLKDNARSLKACSATIMHVDSMTMLLNETQEKPYDVVFIDPPFSLHLWQQTIDALQEYDWLSPNAAIYIESAFESHYIVPQDWCLHREKITGSVRYCLYYKNA